jgi:uncharacterized repeat protein (TIGR03803 family)
LQNAAVLASLLAGACLTSIAQAQTYSILYQFKPGKGGTFPAAGVTVDAKRNALYGTTYADGEFAAGTVFKLDKSGETVLHSFTGEAGDGEYPYLNGAPTLDSEGNLYGATIYGGLEGSTNCGVSGCGVIFKIDQSGNETVLYQFQGMPGAFDPQGPVAVDSKGNVYGTTPYGGSANAGVSFKVDPAGNETIFYYFSYDLAYTPMGGLVADSKGNLFGTTEGGGNGGGSVFEIDRTGVFNILYDFSYTDGAGPLASLAFDKQGNLYGTTSGGGAYQYGTVFKLTPAGAETVLYNFNYLPPGPVDPYASGVVVDSAGNVYGTTMEGGTYNLGTVYKIDTNLDLTVLHSFGGPDGKVPYGNLAIDPSGDLYGTASQGGKFGGGVIFRIKP